MKMRVQLIIEDATGTTTATDIAVIERHTEDLIGLSLEEAKAMTGAVQQRFVEAQAREAIERDSTCPACQARLRRNGSHPVQYRTPFRAANLAQSPALPGMTQLTHTGQA